MTWTRVSDDWISRVRNADLSPMAALFHVNATVECNNSQNDGLINTKSLRAVGVDFDQDYMELVEELVEKFGWLALDGGMYQVPWGDQEPSEVVQRRKAQGVERQRRYRERGLDMKDERLNGDASRYGTPSRAVPSRPHKGKGKANGSGSSSPQSAAGAAPSATPPTQNEKLISTVAGLSFDEEVNK